MNNTVTYSLNVLRGSKWITQYPITGTIIQAKAEARRLADEVHCGAVVSVENMSGLVVAVAK